MQKNMRVRVVVITAIIAVASLGIATIIGFAAGGFRPARFGGFGAAVDERKSVSLAGIDLVSVTSVSEDVRVLEATGDSVEAWLHGTASAADPASVPRLAAEAKGGTIDIRLERKTRWVTGFNWSDLVLEVSIPKGYAGKLSVEGVSADIEISDHAYAGVSLASTSGDIRVGAVGAADFSMHTTSGNLRAASLAAERCELSSVSGDIEVKSLSGGVNAHTTSGEVALTLAEAFPRAEVGSTSGDVTLRLPADAQFSLEARSTSGNVTCAFPITIADSRSGGGRNALSGTVGGGKGSVSVRTVSGDIRVAK